MHACRPHRGYRFRYGRLGYPSLERRCLKDVAVIIGPGPANYLVLVAGTIK